MEILCSCAGQNIAIFRWEIGIERTAEVWKMGQRETRVENFNESISIIGISET